MTARTGTPVTGPYSSYTAEQLAALETMKDRAYTLGIARAELANTVLHPDGTTSDDVTTVINAAREALAALLAVEPKTAATLRDATVAAARIEEIVDHVAQHRFLFVVDAQGLPVVYFQCAVDENPDLPMAVAEHPDPAAYAEHAAEVAAHIAETIAQAQAAHAARTAAATSTGRA